MKYLIFLINLIQSTMIIVDLLNNQLDLRVVLTINNLK
jgi:hypothetical protein